MSTSSAVVMVLVIAVLTYTMRAGIIVGLAGRELPWQIERALRYVGPAVLAALAMNLAAGGDGGPNLEFAQGASLVVAGVVAAWRRDLIQTVAAGMVTLWVLTALVG